MAIHQTIRTDNERIIKDYTSRFKKAIHNTHIIICVALYIVMKMDFQPLIATSGLQYWYFVSYFIRFAKFSLRQQVFL